jgi:hypothetical protein
MLFILTYFHMYWKVKVLQDIYMDTMEDIANLAKEMKKGHSPKGFGPTTDKTKAQAHSGIDHVKVVAGRHYLGAGIPPGAPPSSSFHAASPSGSSMMVACGHAWKSPPNRPCHGYK